MLLLLELNFIFFFLLKTRTFQHRYFVRNLSENVFLRSTTILSPFLMVFSFLGQIQTTVTKSESPWPPSLIQLQDPAEEVSTKDELNTTQILTHCILSPLRLCHRVQSGSHIVSWRNILPRIGIYLSCQTLAKYIPSPGFNPPVLKIKI